MNGNKLHRMSLKKAGSQLHDQTHECRFLFLSLLYYGDYSGFSNMHAQQHIIKQISNYILLGI